MSLSPFFIMFFSIQSVRLTAHAQYFLYLWPCLLSHQTFQWDDSASIKIAFLGLSSSTYSSFYQTFWEIFEWVVEKSVTVSSFIGFTL